jgi:hypothetical protein
MCFFAMIDSDLGVALIYLLLAANHSWAFEQAFRMIVIIIHMLTTLG